MTRTVFNNSMLAHVWAQQSQPEGRSSNGNFFFDGPTIYSYRRSFPVASFVTMPDGGAAVLFTTRSYSVTTTRHKSDAHAAIRSQRIFMVNDPCSQDWPAMFAEYRARLADALTACARARKNRDWKMRNAVDLAAEGNTFAEAAHLAERLSIPDNWQNEIATAEKTRRAAERAVRIEQDKAAAEKISAWLAGENVNPPRTSTCHLRIVGEELQTSWGARVPLADAIRAFRHAAHARENNIPLTGLQIGTDASVGGFRVDSIAPDGTIRAGCHVIGWREAARVAAGLGLLSASA